MAGEDVFSRGLPIFRDAEPVRAPNIRFEESELVTVLLENKAGELAEVARPSPPTMSKRRKRRWNKPDGGDRSSTGIPIGSRSRLLRQQRGDRHRAVFQAAVILGLLARSGCANRISVVMRFLGKFFQLGLTLFAQSRKLFYIALSLFA
jgi:hypothetical protein